MRLRRSHPNFFVALAVLVIVDGTEAAVNLFGPDRSFASRTLVEVNRIEPIVWGVAYAIAAVLLAYNMRRTTTFHLVRVALAIGFFTTSCRIILLATAGSITFTGLPAWIAVGGMHLASLMESPVNPATATIDT